MKKLNVLLAGMAVVILMVPVLVSADTQPVLEPEEIIQPQPVKPEESGSNTATLTRPASPQAFQLNWLSINGGGAINASSASYQLGLSVGQSVAGFATSSSYQMGIGFWYGAATGAPACAAAKGDLNGVGGLSPSDVVLMLRCVFNSDGTGTIGGDCNLCYADVNCLGGLTPSDVVLELLAVFNGQPFPC